MIKNNLKICFFVLAIVVIGCRLKFATQDQGAQLASLGAFPGGTPAWVGQSRSGAARIPEGTGLIPQSFGLPRIAESENRVTGADFNDVDLAKPNRAAASGVAGGVESNVNSQFVNTGIESSYRSSSRGGQDGEEKIGVDQGLSDEDSPIARIEKSCSGIEKQVSDALRTTDVRERIGKYEALTRRCPVNADIWVWLGKDYKTTNRLVEAHRCFEQALIVDHDHQVAKALLTVVKKRLNSPVDNFSGQE